MTKLICFCLSIMISLASYCQYPNFNGISTNPSNPINTQLTIKRNTFFDWQQPSYQIKPLPGGNCPRGDSITSPFFRLDNCEELRTSKDMKWEDGWELIARRVGLKDNNTPKVDNDQDIAIILYNKYNGKLRILLQTCPLNSYQSAVINIKFDASTSVKSDLLEFSRGGISALDKLFLPTEGTAGYNRPGSNYSKWFYADFPMMFDPCIAHRYTNL